jgi:valyl-tRNA synthetase
MLMESRELPTTYDFRKTEARIYSFWEKGGYFQPANDPRSPGFDPTLPPFVISIPPPNVTGELHLGQAMFAATEDLMIRQKRMAGAPALWVPGTDHAGIATQLQVEKALAQEGLRREDIGREAFLERTWAWKAKYGGIISGQIRRLGASCDWSRERFTLDENLSRAVREAFVRLYEKGWIYRGPRLINWSPGLRTAVSDLEVEYSEEPGTLYFFKYRLADSVEEFIPVATTRPETILGDTALAVHPEDERFSGYIGRKVRVPVIGREIPVIGDAYVDREFGTGALKVTPGHDPNDYQIAQRHNLDILSVLDESARINENGGPYAGLDRFDGRKKLWEDMRSAGLVIREEPYMLNVPRSQRGGEIVEPMISTQWFIQMDELAGKALEAVRSGEVRIVPERFTKVYYNWLENIQDWCISRQLWWGHRIPVWYCGSCGEKIVPRQDPNACPFCGSTDLEQDPDVLDTWFSSGLWPFSTLGWPDDTPDLRYFYPTSVLETGYDILFFWVARMIMFGLEFTGQAPFHTVYLHGLIRDSEGRKMSKTIGNVIDPIKLMDEFGTDAVRFTLLVGSTPGNDMNLSISKVAGNRNFANKIWNASRFILRSIPQAPEEPESGPAWTRADSWIWAELQDLIRDGNRLFESYQYGEAGRQIYDFFWGQFADWYLEIAKLQLAEEGDRAHYTASTLTRVLDVCLRMLHPFTPFVTEELWGYLRGAAQERSSSFGPRDGWPEALIVAPWPNDRPLEGWEEGAKFEFGLVQDVIRAIRTARADKGLNPRQKIPAILLSEKFAGLLEEERMVLCSLASLDPARLTISASLSEKPALHIPLVAGPVEILLPLEGLVDTSVELGRLEKELAEVQNQIGRLEKLLSGPFAQNAPGNVVAKERDRLAGSQETAAKLKGQIDSIRDS